MLFLKFSIFNILLFFFSVSTYHPFSWMYVYVCTYTCVHVCVCMNDGQYACLCMPDIWVFVFSVEKKLWVLSSFNLKRCQDVFLWYTASYRTLFQMRTVSIAWMQWSILSSQTCLCQNIISQQQEDKLGHHFSLVFPSEPLQIL